jgi:peptidoglycan/xylan/chitin deacetylase (PgdA/CDA1 family)
VLGHKIINLTFHGIGEPPRRLEPGEEQIWLDPEQFEAILDSAVGQSQVRITFDDGNHSDLDHALPALCRRRLNATFFVVAGRLGAPGFLDESAVRALVAAGMDVGSHGMHHRPWRQLDDHELREELWDAKRLLEGVVGRPVTQAACPFGSYDCRVLRALRRHAYRRAYTSDRGTARAGNWIQARNTVRPTDATGMIERILSERVSPYAAVRRRLKLAGMRWP